ncbi:AAA family ATPase [Alicyclobacillus sacchari]
MANRLRTEFETIREQIGTVVFAPRSVVHLLLVAIVAGGHCLIEDVPGVGKTTLVRALATVLGCQLQRIQFTPDMLPSDVIGFSVYDKHSGQFEFRRGPVFGQMILADEINRTSPRTQSALLQAMEERAVTVDGQTYPLPSPFIVLATENPVEFEGTFPLPEAQLDRFLFRLSLGYPNVDDEVLMLVSHGEANPLASLEQLASPERIGVWQQGAATVHVDLAVLHYIAELSAGTRRHPQLNLGASPRASLALLRAAKANAYLSGRTYVVPDDVQCVATHVLAHRLRLAPEARFAGVAVTDVIEQVITEVPVPHLDGAR